MRDNQGKVNSKILIIILAVLLVLAGVYWFVLKDDDDTSSSKTTASTSQSQSSGDQTYNGSLADLAAAGKSRKCTFTYNAPSGGTGTGTSFTDGKGQSKLTIVTTTSDGKESTINTIVKSGKSYAWFVADGQSIGYVSDAKVPQSSDTSTSSNTSSTSQNGTVSADQKFSMKCVSWTVDENEFVVPTDITFVTIPSSSTTPQQ